MPRRARLVVPGCPHHIVQRGNNRQQVFFVDEDRRYYPTTSNGSASRPSGSVSPCRPTA